MRWSFRAAAAGVIAIGFSLSPVYALKMAIRSPVQRAIAADVVVVGKVTAIEKETVEALPFPGAPNKLAYKVAVVKIESPLIGADNITHVKIGFIASAQPDLNAQRRPGGIRPLRGPLPPFELKEGQEMLFFLAKHPSGEFYVTPSMSPPVDVKNDEGKKELEAVKKVVAVMADPMKGLKSDKADVRAETAAILAMKYRTHPDGVPAVDHVAIDADESKLILKGLAEADWSNNIRPAPGGGAPTALQAFYSLGLSDQDGWKPPQPKPGANFQNILQASFVKWLDGPGKNFRIQKVVPKK